MLSEVSGRCRQIRRSKIFIQQFEIQPRHKDEALALKYSFNAAMPPQSADVYASAILHPNYSSTRSASSVDPIILTAATRTR